jgi:glycosyltransferase involved in cell wall biosynthesis
VRVTVIIPLFNKGTWILRTLDSIAKQRFEDFEVLVVDDGSTDGGEHIVDNYGDGRFRLITQPNAGPGAARNRGIAEARGEFLAFLDADDEWLPNYIENSIRVLDRLGENVASVSSGYIEYPDGISREPMWRGRGLTEGPFRLCPNTQPLAAVYRLAYMSPWSTVVRAATLRKWGGFYCRNRCMYAEDTYVFLKILLNETVAFDLAPTVCVHGERSELSRNLKGARPVEPFLQDPSGIEAACPPNLRELLSNILAIRALKTACVLGYWGRWREARSIRKRFSVPGNWKMPYYLPARICGTPVGARFGEWARALRRIRETA